jgi:hypothetical protein
MNSSHVLCLLLPSVAHTRTTELLAMPPLPRIVRVDTTGSPSTKVTTAFGDARVGLCGGLSGVPHRVFGGWLSPKQRGRFQVDSPLE